MLFSNMRIEHTENMTIDNFDIIRRHLEFKSDFDRYIVHIIKRAKDEDGKKYGVNQTNRLLKTFYITSTEYFDKKIPVIKDLCETNNARAYILPQVRDNSACLKELLKIVVDNLDNPTIKPDHLIRSAYCGYHGSRDKKWILDLDFDNMTEYKTQMGFPGDQEIKKEWTYEQVLELVKEMLVQCGKMEDDAYMIPTKNGMCIITSPFDLKKAYNRCHMFYEGQTKMCVDRRYTGPGEWEPVQKDVNGWLIKDGMALIYFNGEEK